MFLRIQTSNCFKINSLSNKIQTFTLVEHNENYTVTNEKKNAFNFVVVLYSFALH